MAELTLKAGNIHVTYDYDPEQYSLIGQLKSLKAYNFPLLGIVFYSSLKDKYYWKNREIDERFINIDKDRYEKIINIKVFHRYFRLSKHEYVKFLKNMNIPYNEIEGIIDDIKNGEEYLIVKCVDKNTEMYNSIIKYVIESKGPVGLYNQITDDMYNYFVKLSKRYHNFNPDEILENYHIDDVKHLIDYFLSDASADLVDIQRGISNNPSNVVFS